MDSVRVDRWLCAARLFKSRTQARDACVGGAIRVNGLAVKPHHPIRVGDEIAARAPSRLRIVGVVALAERRLPAPRARELYDDRSPPPPPREEPVARRARGAGRPTKRERRALQRLRSGRPS